MNQAKQQVIVIGGGFAGVAAAKILQQHLPDAYQLTLISEESYTTFNPMLPEVVGASVFPEHLVAPLRQVIDIQGKANFVMARVEQIDYQAKLITCTSLNGRTEIPYAQAILAIGNRARIDFLPGMKEFALPLKTIGDAIHIRNEVLRRIAKIEITADAATREKLGHFIILGGGFSGVEVAGAIVDCLRSITRYYPRVDPKILKVSLVHDGDRLLPELEPMLGLSAQKSLEARKVKVLLGKSACGILDNGIQFSNGDTLAGGTVIATIGTQANSLLTEIGLPTERGRLLVNADMSVKGIDGLWAAGDCALVLNQLDNSFSPPTAQFAVREGKFLAHNLIRKIQGQETRAFSYQSKGSMATVGHMKGVASVFGVKLTGLAAWLFWRAYYLSQMPTLGRKIRIYVDWTWGMFFPVDITHFRFQRTAEIIDEVARDKKQEQGRACEQAREQEPA